MNFQLHWSSHFVFLIVNAELCLGPSAPVLNVVSNSVPYGVTSNSGGTTHTADILKGLPPALANFAVSLPPVEGSLLNFLLCNNYNVLV